MQSRREQSSPSAVRFLPAGTVQSSVQYHTHPSSRPHWNNPNVIIIHIAIHICALFFEYHQHLASSTLHSNASQHYHNLSAFKRNRHRDGRARRIIALVERLYVSSSSSQHGGNHIAIISNMLQSSFQYDDGTRTALY